MKPALLGKAPGHHLTLAAPTPAPPVPVDPPPPVIVERDEKVEYVPSSYVRRRTLAEFDAALAKHHKTPTKRTTVS